MATGCGMAIYLIPIFRAISYRESLTFENRNRLSDVYSLMQKTVSSLLKLFVFYKVRQRGVRGPFSKSFSRGVAIGEDRTRNVGHDRL